MKWKPWVSPVLLLTLSVPPAGAAVSPGGQGSSSSAPAFSEATATEALNSADRSGPRRARRRAESTFRDGIPIESIARAREYLRARAACERPSPAAWCGWETFYAACDGCIRSFASAMGLRGADLDDCTQDVWADLTRSLPRFELDSSRGRFTSWLYAIVRSKAADHKRRRSRKPAVNLSSEAAASLAARNDDNPLRRCE